MGTLEGYVEGMINLSGGGGGGTSDYEELSNKPSINNVELIGNKTSGELGINSMPSSEGAGIGDVLTHTISGDGWYPPIKELPVFTSADEGKILTISNDNVVWGSFSSGVNYSTNEQVIGTWIDGKPLYQITIAIDGNYTGNGNITISDIPSNIDVKIYNGIMSYQDGNIYKPVGIGNNYIIYPFNTFNTIRITIGSGTYHFIGSLTIQYTKDSD